MEIPAAIWVGGLTREFPTPAFVDKAVFVDAASAEIIYTGSSESLHPFPGLNNVRRAQDTNRTTYSALTFNFTGQY